jgi:FixJ family two-component response regulator
MTSPAPKPARIGLIEDDQAMRRALRRLLGAAGYEVDCWESADHFLAAGPEPPPDCLLLDVSMPGTNGIELQQRLLAAGCRTPIVFLTGKGDIPMTVRALKAGAVDFLTKPVDRANLFAALRNALDLAARRQSAQRLVDSLTPREREVFAHVISGRLNKQIAADLGTSEQTIKVHRMRLMEKLGENSVAGLVRLAERLSIPPAAGRDGGSGAY